MAGSIQEFLDELEGFFTRQGYRRVEGGRRVPLWSVYTLFVSGSVRVVFPFPCLPSVPRGSVVDGSYGRKYLPSSVTASSCPRLMNARELPGGPGYY